MTSLPTTPSEIARRRLRDASDQEVELVVYSPVVDPGHSDSWICKTTITTSSGTTTFDNTGVDSLQALALGLGSLRFGLRQLGLTQLTWLDLAGETGLPVVIQEIDENFQRLMESLQSAELARQAMWQKAIRQRSDE